MKWTEKIIVDAHDTDAEQKARPAALLRYMQSAANLQLHHCGPSNETLLERGQAFILSRIAISFLQPAYVYDELSASSWSCPSRGFSFQRCYDIMRGDCKIAEAASVWALTDIQTHKLLRADCFSGGYTPEACITPDAPLRFTLPEDMPDVGVHTVSYAEIDWNRHMNNVRYLDMICDFLDMRHKTPSAVTIAFLAEAPEYSRIRITKKECGDEVFFRTFREDGKVNVEAYVKLTDRSTPSKV